MIMTRDAFKDLLMKQMRLPEDQAAAVTAITDARAEMWAQDHNSTPEEWYRTHFKDVVPRRGEALLDHEPPPLPNFNLSTAP